MKVSAPLQIILCFTIGLLVACTSNSTETLQPASVVEITAFPSTMKIDNIAIEFTGYKRDLKYFKIIICFAPPKDQVWILEDVHFKIDNREIPNSRGNVFGGTDLGRADGFDCGYIYYPTELIPRTGKADLSIGQLKAYWVHKDCDRAQKYLDQTKTGIVITCDPTIVDQDSRFFVVTKKPTTVSDKDADLVALDAFSDSIQVNWHFSFVIDKP